MTPPSSHLAGALSQLHPIGTLLIDTATVMAQIRDELPKRGALRDLHLELLDTLTHIERTYQDANDHLLTAYNQLEHAERNIGWTHA